MYSMKVSHRRTAVDRAVAQSALKSREIDQYVALRLKRRGR